MNEILLNIEECIEQMYPYIMEEYVEEVSTE